jgi:hypothetical protein
MVPMGAPFQGAVPFLKQLDWLKHFKVPEPDHSTYLALWAAMSEEISKYKKK